jgi:hypothetical protein
MEFTRAALLDGASKRAAILHRVAKSAEIAIGGAKQSSADTTSKGLRHRQAANATLAPGKRSSVAEEQDVERFEPQANRCGRHRGDGTHASLPRARKEAE